MFSIGNICCFIALIAAAILNVQASDQSGDSRQSKTELDPANIDQSGLNANVEKFYWQEPISGSTCGVFAACSAIQRLGGLASPKNFIRAKYVGTCSGATQYQVAAVIEDCGFVAFHADRLSIFDLRFTNLPCIAFVRGDSATSRYNHWVFVEFPDNDVLVFDGVKAPYTLKMAEFMSIWSGRGIFVSKPHELSPLLQIYIGRALLVSLAFGLVVLANRFVSSVTFLDRRMLSIAKLGFLSLVLSAYCGCFFHDLKNYEMGVNVAISPYYGNLEEVPLTKAIDEMDKPDVLVVDARRQVDYEMHSIKGAVNIPVYADREEIKRFLAGLGKNQAIYVFCQSSRCDFDEVVGRKIMTLGFKNVKVCAEGWNEYHRSSNPSLDVRTVH